MTNPLATFYDASSNETVIREMTDDEYAEYMAKQAKMPPSQLERPADE